MTLSPEPSPRPLPTSLIFRVAFLFLLHPSSDFWFSAPWVRVNFFLLISVKEGESVTPPPSPQSRSKV